MLFSFQKNFYFLKKEKTTKAPNIVYKFKFASLISPYLISDLRLHQTTASDAFSKKPTLLLKQSYLLLTWFYYLKHSTVVKNRDVRKLIKFAFLPTRRTSYTLIKAPMAHKTNSKEQLVFRVFYFTTSIKTDFKFSNQPNSLQSALLVLFLTRSLFPIFETNLLLLKSYVFTLKMSDSRYFNYNRFVKLIKDY